MLLDNNHYFDSSLLISNGLAFQTYLAQDRKLIAESHAILLSTVSKIASDEQPGPVEIGTYMQLKMSPDPMTASMGLALESLWNDLTPADNFCTIDLKNGAVK